MTVRNYFSIFIATVVVFPVLTFAADQPSAPNRPAVSGIVNPHLSQLKSLNVFLVEPFLKVDFDQRVWTNLKKRIENKLSGSNPRLKKLIKLGSKADSALPQLQIIIEALNPDGKNDKLFTVETSLMVEFILDRQRKQVLETRVWGLRDAVLVQSTKGIPTVVGNLALKHTDVFIKAWLLANPKYNKTADPSAGRRVSVKSSKPAKSSDKNQPVQFEFVASKNSKVFHLPSCSSARRIKPQNLINYKVRGEARKDGKRPCKRCKP